jgi:nicotinamidase-related amidase
MIKFEINPQKTALIVFDMMNDFCKPGFPREYPWIREVLVPKIKRLIEHCRSNGIPVIYSTISFRRDGIDMGIMAETVSGVKERKSFIRGTEGAQVYDEIKPQEGDIVVDKQRYSAFFGCNLDSILRGMGKDTVIVVGWQTNIGMESTVRDAVNHDYKVIYPSDGTGSRGLPDMGLGWGPISGEEVLRVSLSTLAYRFAMVLPTDELISKLQ